MKRLIALLILVWFVTLSLSAQIPYDTIWLNSDEVLVGTIFKIKNSGIKFLKAGDLDQVMIKNKEILNYNYLEFDNLSEIQFNEVSTVTGTKKELFQRARLWLANTYSSSKDDIDISDPDGGVIVAEIKDGLFGKEQIFYTLKLLFKDNKYKMAISECEFKWSEDTDPLLVSLMPGTKRFGEINTGFLANLRWRLEDLKSYMSEKGEDEDW